MSRHTARPGLNAPMSTQEINELAHHRAQAKMGWYTHALIYICVIGALALLGAWQGRHWPLGPALGWGLGLAIHGLRVFVIGAGSDLRARMVERERQRLVRTPTLDGSSGPLRNAP